MLDASGFGSPPPVIVRLGEDLALAFERVERAEAQQPVRRRLRMVPPRARFAAGFAAATAIIVAFVAINGGGGAVRSLTTEVALAKVARQAAAAPLPAPDEFAYTKARWLNIEHVESGSDMLGRSVEPYSALFKESREQWLSETREGLAIYGEPTRIYPTETDRARGERFLDAQREADRLMTTPQGRERLKRAFAEAGERSGGDGHYLRGTVTEVPGAQRVELSPAETFTIAGEQIPRSQIGEYPRDPHEIYLRVTARHENPGTPPAAIWQSLTTPLQSLSPPLPPDLRAALVETLGQVPGIEVLGERTDELGRTGTAFGRTSEGVRETVIFDSGDGTLLSSESRVVEPDPSYRGGLAREWPPGTVIDSFLLIEQKTVGSLPAG